MSKPSEINGSRKIVSADHQRVVYEVAVKGVQGTDDYPVEGQTLSAIVGESAADHTLCSGMGYTLSEFVGGTDATMVGHAVIDRYDADHFIATCRFENHLKR